MEVKLVMKDDVFTASNAQGAAVALGPSSGEGISPVEALLMAAGGCSGLDVSAILRKMRQPLAGLEITVSGQRHEEHPRYFSSILIEYTLKGELEADKVERAIELSLQKYCSVTNSLAPTVNITYEYTIERGNADESGGI